MELEFLLPFPCAVLNSHFDAVVPAFANSSVK